MMITMSAHIDGGSAGSKMAPSRSTQNLISKMELASKNTNDTKMSPRYYPAPDSSPNSNGNNGGGYRFGTPDTRASYSERRLMSVRRTAHNHPSPVASGAACNGNEKSGRCMSVSLAALSRSNGSLAADADSNGNTNSKLRSRTQVLLFVCA